MLVKINSNVFVLASSVISVKRDMRTNSESHGKWFAAVKHEHGLLNYAIPDGEVDILISDINRFLEK